MLPTLCISLMQCSAVENVVEVTTPFPPSHRAHLLSSVSLFVFAFQVPVQALVL